MKNYTCRKITLQQKNRRPFACFLTMLLLSTISIALASCGGEEDGPGQENYFEGGITDEGDVVTEGDAIDLGLSVKWASRNVDAPSPEKTGGLYGWGDPTGKKVTTDLEQYPTPIPPEDICGTEYDIARAKWGGKWRLPSVQEMRELVQKCTWKWVTYNGRDGMLVTGPNGNSIFLPAVGFVNERSSWNTFDDDLNPSIQVDGYYWTGTLYGTEGTDVSRACFLFFNKWDEISFSKRTNYNFRSTGQSVRAVYD